jgi:hypothetical protein
MSHTTGASVVMSAVVLEALYTEGPHGTSSELYLGLMKCSLREFLALERRIVDTALTRHERVSPLLADQTRYDRHSLLLYLTLCTSNVPSLRAQSVT